MIKKTRVQDSVLTYGHMNLIFRARNLWRDLVLWSRVYLTSRLGGIGITEDVFNRIYRIPLEFGDIIRFIFGNQAAETIVQQLSSNVILYRELVEAMISGDNEAASAITQQLYVNADQRAAFMASINPFWDETQWKNLIYTFYNYSFQEIISILTNDPGNVALFDRFLQYTDIMGDYFAQGLYNYLAYNTVPAPAGSA